MHISITQPGLVTQTIAYTPESTAQLTEHHTGVNLWVALDVDGNLYDLCCWKHTVGRPELIAACDRALYHVRAAIVAARLEGQP